jgi:hypothetical protein
MLPSSDLFMVDSLPLPLENIIFLVINYLLFGSVRIGQIFEFVESIGAVFRSFS